MRSISFETSGTCSKHIFVDVDDDNRIVDVRFVGGCNGNLKGLCALVKGAKAEEIKQRLRGIECRDKGTSCPDQLARALEQIGY